MKFEMTEYGFETETEFGKLEISSNEEKGFRPYQLMVGSIAACTGGVMRKILEKKRMPAQSITIEVKEVVRSQDDASRLEKIHYHITVQADGLTEEKMPKILELTHKNCSMYQSVANCIEIEQTVEILK
ncbi:OsmC family protein [Sporosarcina aquimarina]|uniref:OsmC family protein n=1 Tax=Sporosarcina aquimarina TaxID=114975 RepID=A0ABU4G390_9BACL|nr:OsmC family protein [Sporosarcina aquimarina]MDW0110837.1 OsmC family protein [Sporosarcina aquimarina]